MEKEQQTILYCLMHLVPLFALSKIVIMVVRIALQAVRQDVQILVTIIVLLIVLLVVQHPVEKIVLKDVPTIALDNVKKYVQRHVITNVFGYVEVFLVKINYGIFNKANR